MTAPEREPGRSEEAARLQALAGTARRLAEDPNVQQALWELARAIRRDLSVDRTAVFVYEPTTRSLERLAAVSPAGEIDDLPNRVRLDDRHAPLAAVARRDRSDYIT